MPRTWEALVPESTETPGRGRGATFPLHLLTSALSWDVSAGIPLPGKVQVLGEGCYSDITATPLLSPALSHWAGCSLNIPKSDFCWPLSLSLPVQTLAHLELQSLCPACAPREFTSVCWVSSTRVSQEKPSSCFITGWSQCLGSISCPSGQLLQLRSAGFGARQGSDLCRLSCSLKLIKPC